MGLDVEFAVWNVLVWTVMDNKRAPVQAADTFISTKLTEASSRHKPRTEEASFAAGEVTHIIYAQVDR